jgi:hypothetical protein
VRGPLDAHEGFQQGIGAIVCREDDREVEKISVWHGMLLVDWLLEMP